MRLKTFFTFMLCCVAISVSAQELWTSNTLTNLPEHLSAKELISIEHREGINGYGVINITKKNGTEYSLPAANVENINVQTAAKAIVHDSRYKNMMWIADINNLQNLESGTLLGTFSEDDFSVEDFRYAAYSELSKDPGLAALDTALQSLINMNATALAAKTKIRKANIRIHRTSIAYVSTDIDGTKIVLTGNLLYPYSSGEKKILACSDIYLDNHMTIFNDAKAPSQIMSSGALMQGACTRGFLVVQPDLIGLGASKARTQLYVDKTVNPTHITDCLLAAMQYEGYSKTDGTSPLNIDPSAQIIVSGGSQGATCALATTYYMENKMPAEKRAKLPAIKETRLCAGSYDMKLTLANYCQTDRVIFSPIVPLLLQGVFSAHREEMVDENGKPYSLHDFFVPQLRTRSWDTTAFGLPGYNTIWQMLDSKCLESAPLIMALTEACGAVDPTITKIGCYSQTSRMLNKDLLVDNGDGSFSLNEASPKVKAFSKVLVDNDLTNADEWVPQSDIHMIHGVDDYMVPYGNSKQFYDNMYEKMKQNGHVISLKTLDDCDSMGNHIIVCAIWSLSEISGLDFDTIAKMM